MVKLLHKVLLVPNNGENKPKGIHRKDQGKKNNFGYHALNYTFSKPDCLASALKADTQAKLRHPCVNGGFPACESKPLAGRFIENLG